MSSLKSLDLIKGLDRDTFKKVSSIENEFE